MMNINKNSCFSICKKLLLAGVISISPIAAFADSSNALPEGGRLAEVHVLSLQFQNRNQASLVARPCDKGVGCNNMIARIDGNTTLRDNGVVINFNQAKRLKWELAVLVVDKFNNALMLSRIPASNYDD